ncbi:MAG: phosphoglucomutase/phosphomannomutase family protein [Clostridia bacterium]|nr:phosphoglucomutase/phosphomannomutase family protein [Clostridia bacterium]MBQ4608685.1 phosphoglucomutase/phosphomannomutase family protein [Clostridia bacterium]MBQ6858546.1 phosphoglucomutase/phosphomannomutase family protein [Clostridia bacterium]MBQ7053436.1 phosphoglucomutase/phosphomannomutase family protein [Clostridia bacterium]
MIRFGTGGWREVIGDGFTRANIRRIACAVARKMKNEGVEHEGFCIGYDRRFLSRESAIWFSEVMAAEGIRLYFVNLAAPTPQIMFTVKNMNLPYGAAVTASHNPAVYNGIKLFTRGGRDATEDVTSEISALANALQDQEIASMSFETALSEGRVLFIDPRDEYLDSIMEKIDMEAIRARRPRVVLDPMYGVSLSGLMTILFTARCDVDVINDRHDAFFGGHLPAPNPDTLRDLQGSVADHHADLGIATDGDADRLGIIDERGRYVSANDVLVLLYYYLLRYKGWKGAAVRNIATTHRLDRVAEAFGEKCYEVPVGFKHISAGMDAHDALIGGESSGGLTVRGHISGKDGLYAASLLVEMVSATRKPLSRLLAELEKEFGTLHMAEYDWALTTKSREAIHRRVMIEKQLPDFGMKIGKISYRDGCKVYFDEGWIIVRFSGTEPRVRIFAEMPTKERARSLVRIMAGFLELEFHD